MSFDPNAVYYPHRIYNVNHTHCGMIDPRTLTLSLNVILRFHIDAHLDPFIMGKRAAAIFGLLFVLIVLVFFLNDITSDFFRDLRWDIRFWHDRNAFIHFIARETFARTPEAIVILIIPLCLAGAFFWFILWPWIRPNIGMLEVVVTDKEVIINWQKFVPLSGWEGFAPNGTYQNSTANYIWLGFQYNGTRHHVDRLLTVSDAEEVIMWTNNAIREVVREDTRSNAVQAGRPKQIPMTHQAPPPKPKRRRFVDK